MYLSHLGAERSAIDKAKDEPIRTVPLLTWKTYVWSYGICGMIIGGLIAAVVALS